MCILYVGVLYFREFLLSVYSNDKRAVGWRRVDVFFLLLGLSPVTMKGCHFDQLGGNYGHAGVLHKSSRVARAYPRNHVVKRGDHFNPSCATVPFAPTTCPPPKKKLRVLGMGCRHIASSSEWNLKQDGARGRAFRGRVLPTLTISEN